ncbi:kinase-like protein [Saccharata proteae CBS 121410]|uniref:Kinase-like protein n=1 Tax=Saccharata proteae CBS 121410 TaxID=1314787 RepID=A0A9P4HZ36_9PEZI|nr:kinase-like protein [Saccharata proteae CBS 121410]
MNKEKKLHTGRAVLENQASPPKPRQHQPQAQPPQWSVESCQFSQGIRPSPASRDTAQTRFKAAYHRTRQIGEGGDGVVTLCESNHPGQNLAYAVKTYQAQGNTSKIRFKTEVSTLELLKWKAACGSAQELLIVNILWANDPKNIPLSVAEMHFAVEYCHLGDLESFRDGYKMAKQDFPAHYIASMFRDIVEAVAFIHHGWGTTAYKKDEEESKWARMMHRDIKPSNFLLRQASPDKFRVVLSDFGTATFWNKRSFADENCGTDLYLPPEYPICTPCMDTWGIGATIHYLVHAKEPLDWDVIPQLYDHSYNYRKAPRKALPIPSSGLWKTPALAKIREELNCRMLVCLEIYPARRPKVDILANLQWPDRTDDRPLRVMRRG